MTYFYYGSSRTCPDSTPPVWWVGHWWPNGRSHRRRWATRGPPEVCYLGGHERVNAEYSLYMVLNDVGVSECCYSCCPFTVYFGVCLWPSWYGDVMWCDCDTCTLFICHATAFCLFYAYATTQIQVCSSIVGLSIYLIQWNLCNGTTYRSQNTVHNVECLF